MWFINKISEYRKILRQVENNIYGEKQEYLEIYEKNQQLEKEIAERAVELDTANKRMLTLQHIWDMMNSSTPLENVMDKIVNSIHGDLGYLHCAIIRNVRDDNQNYMELVIETKESAISKDIAAITANNDKIPYDNGSIFADALRNKKIIQTSNIKNSLILPCTDNILKLCHSIIVIPLYAMKEDFGWFLVFNSRDELATTEKDFLALFARQIEMSITIADLFSTVKSQAITDPLTGLYNRRHFEETLNKEVIRAKRQHQAFSVIGIDLDFLKKINDQYGHAYGDLAIKTIANVLKSNARSIDLPARMGGEEFDVLLPGIDSTGAMIAAERIRKTIEATELDVIGHITASVGVATFFEHTDNAEELLELTDQAMYVSKRNGRNRVTLAKPVSETSWQETAINAFLDIITKRKIPIPQDVAKELEEKLETSKTEISKDTLYNVADLLTSTYNPMHNMGAVKSKVLLATSLAKRMDLSKDDIDNLRVALLLYDIGNLMLPKELLMKKAPLTDSERQHIKEHPMIAAQKILKPISYVQDVIPIIEYHHENWDGSGYPKQLTREEIPLTSQIILIVDTYFALIEARPYRTKLSSQDALNVIRQEAGKKWDEVLVKEFITLAENDFI